MKTIFTYKARLFVLIFFCAFSLESVILNAQGQKSVASFFPISGYVYDTEGMPLPGALVMQINDIRIGTSTDEKGFFKLNLRSNNSSFEVSLLGYKKQTIRVNNQKTFNIRLEANDFALDETIVNGYYSKTKNSFTGTAVSVTGDEIRNVSNINLFDALKTFDPSFQVVDINGQFGSNPNYVPEQISIRGTNSFPEISEGNLKTAVSLPIFILDGFEVKVQKIYDLDMNRIENITILKDASASAIYGSRAANGVIVIDTKVPDSGVLQISYNLTGGAQFPDLSSYNLMNASQIVEFQRMAGLFNPTISGTDGGANENTYNLIRREILAGVDNDWLSKPLRNGFQHRHTIFIDGSIKNSAEDSNNAIRYSVNLLFGQTNGAMKGSDRDNYGIGTKLIYNNRKLRIINDMQFTTTKSTNSPYGNFSTYTTLLPYHRETDSDGKYYSYLSLENVAPEGMSLGKYFKQESPMYEAEYLNSYSGADLWSFTDNLGINWDISNELKVKGNFSLGFDFERDDIYLSPYSYHNIGDIKDISTTDDLYARGKYELGNSKSITYSGNASLSYTKSFGKHDLQGIVGGEIREIQSRNDSYIRTGFLNEAYDYIAYAQQYELRGRPRGNESTVRSIGTFSNINYAFDNRYLIDLTGRIDGSSLYGRNQQYSAYWSTGVRWNIDRESFIKSIKGIDRLVLRGNIGTTGSQSYSRNQAMNLYTYLPYAYGGFLGASISTLGNPDLQGQLTFNRNIGFELSLLKGRFNLELNYYNNTTERNLTDMTIAPSTGFNSYKVNMGDLTNKGFEFQLKFVPIRTKDILLSVFANGSHNTNKITRISDNLRKYNETINEKADNGEVRNVFLFKEGESMNTIYAVQSLGIDPGTGKEIFLTSNGEKTYTWKAKDQVPVGNIEPILRGSFGFNLQYKDWELSSSFYYSVGADKYNSTLANRIENIDYNVNNDIRALTDRWQKPGDVAKFKAIDDKTTTRASSRFVQKENYLSLTSLRLSYNLNNSTLQNTMFSKIRLSVTCNELFYWSTVKQERGLSYPFTRSVNFSAQANF